jgi:hypothetical protein
VDTQIAWLSIGLASWRFRKAWIKQGRPIDEMKFRASWTWPWGPAFVVRQGFDQYAPHDAVTNVHGIDHHCLVAHSQ